MEKWSKNKKSLLLTSSFGGGNSIFLSILPGRNNAESKISILFVAIITYRKKKVICGRTGLKRPLKIDKTKAENHLVALCRSKVLQNAPLGAFCNLFDLH